MDVLEKACRVLKQPVCGHCLGRQFGQLLSGYTNAERGRILRTIVAMSIDKSKEEGKEEESYSADTLDMSNFIGFKFHNFEFDKKTKTKKCSLCSDLFLGIDKWVKKAAKALKKYSVKTFLVGTKLPYSLVQREEELWERAGIDYCEPLKAEINREIGKRIEKSLKIQFDPKRPDVNFLINIAENKVHVEMNPLFIYGEYQKLVRGIPQTKWPSRKYKTSVEQIIAKPFMIVTKAKGHKLHSLGREDIDARCLGWRPFVLELIKPVNRNIGLQNAAKKIGKGVKVKNMRFSDIAEVRKIKEARLEKTYTMIVECGKEIKNLDLKKLKAIKSIRQRTPQRVLHRRADKYRNRYVRSISAKLLGGKKFRLTVRCEAGLYVKELVSGDNGRTEPSVSSLLGAACSAKDLDVVKIHT